MARKLIAALSDSSLFLREWLANPQHTGSVMPSSPQLAGAMARWLPADPDAFVLELGPGTGAVTDALLKRGLREDRLIAIEHNESMARLLSRRFPRAQIINGDAWQMQTLLQECRVPVDSVGAVISSLPLLNFSPLQAQELADKIRGLLAPRGCWVQYSYRIGRLRNRGTEDFRLISSQIVWLNLPPARVCVYQP